MSVSRRNVTRASKTVNRAGRQQDRSTIALRRGSTWRRIIDAAVAQSRRRKPIAGGAV